MTLRPHRSEPCWEIVDAATGRPPEEDGGDGWAHYATRADAHIGIAVRLANHERCCGRHLLLRAALSFPGPCLGLFCDGPDCPIAGEPCDMSGEGWTHLDRDDPLPVPVEDMDWLEVGDRHYCPDCYPPWCDDCDEQHYPGDECPAAPPKPAHCEGQLALLPDVGVQP